MSAVFNISFMTGEPSDFLFVHVIHQARDAVFLSSVWYYFSNKMILGGEIRDAKMSSSSSDFQTLIKH